MLNDAFDGLVAALTDLGEALHHLFCRSARSRLSRRRRIRDRARHE